MFSVSGDESDVAKAFKLGANGYMVKPFTVDAFVNALSCVPQIQMIHHLVRKEPHSEFELRLSPGRPVHRDCS